MPRVVRAALARSLPALAATLMSGVAFPAGAANAEAPSLVTNLLQLRQCAEQEPSIVTPIRIDAEVCDADLAQNVLLLRDESGAEFVQLDLQNQDIRPGATVRVEANGCGVTLQNFGLAIIPGMVVDNDGVHGMATTAGTVFLPAGAAPIALQWFNRIGQFGLSVEYEGPGIFRQQIPSSDLFRNTGAGDSSGNGLASGLTYRCYEGAWGYLPDFHRYQPVKSGAVGNFDLGVRTRKDAVGLEFTGYLKISRAGLYTFYLASDDGSRLFVGDHSLQVRVLHDGSAPKPIESIPTETSARKTHPWVALSGGVAFAGVRGAGGELVVRVGNDDIRVELFGNGELPTNNLVGSRIKVSGIYEDVINPSGAATPGLLLATGWQAVQVIPAAEKSPDQTNIDAGIYPVADARGAEAAKSPITSAAEIKALSAAQASRQLPVSIQGVLIATVSALSQGAVVQDSTKGVYLFPEGVNHSKALQCGDFCRIEGVTGPGLFAPVVAARHITCLGPGQLPPPIHATWDQLVNGTLDTQYAEIEGAVTAVHDQRLALLTAGGEVTIDLDDFQADALRGCQNAVVRIRGCFLPYFNLQTHELDSGSLRIKNGVIETLQPAPREAFDAPQKKIGEVLRYDPKASLFRRLDVRGQVICSRPGESFLFDGSNGMRITGQDCALLVPGDQAEAVGFLDVAGPMATLKDSIVRKTGHASLPAPVKLAHDALLWGSHAGALVLVDATLTSQWRDGSDVVLDLESGFLAFRARFNSPGRDTSALPAGSRVEVAGVYVPRSSQALDGTVNGFDLLMPSRDEIRVLSAPSWWTLQRVLILAGAMSLLLCAALFWNKELQWKLEQRGRRLEAEIRHRERAELQRVAEAERSRIARDLHDELGAGLTEVSMVASAGLSESADTEKTSERLRAIAEKARSLVLGLDVIVWAIDPKRNSLQSFADYLGRYVTELFSASNIACRFKIPVEFDAISLNETARHSLFLAVKEALHNVIRHSGATEVELQISRLADCLLIVIADNGRGFDWQEIHPGNGLANLQARLAALNGKCDIEPKPGKGTTVQFTIPLTAAPIQPHVPTEKPDCVA